jgi:predicted nuclease of predicted toxin-antitoxin system
MTMADLRLLIDHNVGRGIARALSRAGYDTLFVGDVDPDLSDAAILHWAVQEQRLVITQDHDFGALVFHSGQPHAGVLLVRMPASSRDERLRVVLWILEQHGAALAGRFSVFESGRLRIR